MSWRSDLLARLRADADLAALFGGRIAWFEAAPSWGEVYPQMVLQSFAAEPSYAHGGNAGLERTLVQFDLYSTNPDDLEDGEAALRAELEQNDVEQGSTRFGFGFLTDGATSTERLANQRAVFRLRLDFDFFWASII